MCKCINIRGITANRNESNKSTKQKTIQIKLHMKMATALAVSWISICTVKTTKVSRELVISFLQRRPSRFYNEYEPP